MKALIFGITTFAAGVLLRMEWGPTSVKAQAVDVVPPPAAVQIEEVPNNNQVKTLRGSRVIGFSCATDGSGAVHCYVITGR